MSIRLSKAYGVNPSIEKCFLCGADKGVVLFGRLKNDQAAPREVVINQEPCNKCQEHMHWGIILISVDEEKSKGDMQNPYRTGGWCVVREAAIKRWIDPGELLDQILKKRVAFLPDEVWDKIGLPRNGD